MIRAEFESVLLVVALAVLLGLACGCKAGSSLPARGDIVSSDGVVLAEFQDAANGQGRRVYALGEAAAHIAGSCYSQNSPGESSKRTPMTCCGEMTCASP